MDRKSVAPRRYQLGDWVRHKDNPHGPAGEVIATDSTGYYVQWHTRNGVDTRHQSEEELTRA